MYDLCCCGPKDLDDLTVAGHPELAESSDYHREGPWK